jgi:sortase A
MQVHKYGYRGSDTAVKIGTWAVLGGVICLALSVLWICHSLWEDYRAGLFCSEVLRELENATEGADEEQALEVSSTDPDYIGSTLLGDTAYSQYVPDPAQEMRTVEIEGNRYIGHLDIPILGLSLPVMDAWNNSDFKRNPCRYSGSAYQGNLTLAASSRKSQFGRLRRLSVGDPVYFTDVDGNVFTYVVAQLDREGSSDLEQLGEKGDGSGWDLTMYACTLGGKARIAVHCTAIAQ